MDKQAPGLLDFVRPQGLCPECASLKLDNKFSAEISGSGVGDTDHAGLDSRELGSLDQIYARRFQCDLCHLIFEAMRGIDKQPSGSLVASWILDARPFDHSDDAGTTVNKQRTLATEALTRRLVISTMDESLHKIYIMPLGHSAAETPLPSFSGRRIGLAHADINLIRKWLRLCLDNHSGVCTHDDAQSNYISHGKGIRFVDLAERCVVKPNTTITYATLSYCWGGAIPFTLSRETCNAMSQPGSLSSEQISRTIRDAMDLVHSLGIRYLWVDALCIMQDDKEDWSVNASLMDKIYGNGLVNICATGGHCNQGIYGTEGTPRLAQQQIAVYNGVSLVAVRPTEALIECTQWNSRGWTFQERILSPRSIIFVEDRVFFQCRGATWSEDIYAETATPTWTVDMLDAPLQAFQVNPVRQFTEYVQLYSSRFVTFQSDRLMAFAGVATALAAPLRSIMLFGLPDAYFDWALLWEPKSSMGRLDSKTFPSWSWCGWEGGVVWRMSMVSGTLLNLHEWLSQRTWIVWYTGPVSSDAKTGMTPKDCPSQEGFNLVWSAREQESRPSEWTGYYATSAGTPFGRLRRYSVLGDERERPTFPTLTPRSGCLHFWTYTAFFRLSQRSMSTKHFDSGLGLGLQRFGLFDARGDWCGTIVLETTWSSQLGSVLEFAAISEARDFSMEELDTWNYYIPAERTSMEWYLFYAILICWDPDRQVTERAGLAKIYQGAFKHASFNPGLSWKEIILG